MEHSSKLILALNTLQQITGIRLDITVETPEEEEFALEQIHCLCTAYQEKYNRTHFLREILTGEISSYEIQERAARLHISTEEPRVIFLLETKSVIDDTISAILKNLFPKQAKVLLVPLTENRIAALLSLAKGEDDNTFMQTAHMIVDTLNMEALTSVQVAYSRICPTLSECTSAYGEVCLAMKVGKLFYSDRTVFPYNKLGIGRLISQLPVPVCEEFLHEIFGPDTPDTLDEELSTTVNRFLQNNLNIAETSRQLHMHRNTLIYRLEQVEKRTGLDLREFEDAMLFKIATMVINYLQTERIHHNE